MGWQRRSKRGLGRLLARLAGAVLALAVLLCRLTTRRQVRFDPRPGLRAAGRPYVYALLHAHQVAAVLASDEPALAAMVSRSRDGELLVPALRARGIVPVRGSGRSAQADKGGRSALLALAAHLRHRGPALLAVDGPRGPRGRVHGGVVALARQCGAVILPVLAIADRRWVLQRSWDRFQVPKPFARVALIFGEPLDPDPQTETFALRGRLAAALHSLEKQYDAQEVETHHASHSAAS